MARPLCEQAFIEKQRKCALAEELDQSSKADAMILLLRTSDLTEAKAVVQFSASATQRWFAHAFTGRLSWEIGMQPFLSESLTCERPLPQEVRNMSSHMISCRLLSPTKSKRLCPHERTSESRATAAPWERDGAR